MSDVEKKAAADKAAELLLIPESKVVKFLGRDVPLRPLPVATAKKLRRLPEKVDELISKLTTQVTHDVKPHQLDEAGAELYVDMAAELCSFYKITDLSKQYIDENATLSEVQLFIQQQDHVQGTEDFLFRQLKNIMGLFSEKGKAQLIQTNQNPNEIL